MRLSCSSFFITSLLLSHGLLQAAPVSVATTQDVAATETTTTLKEALIAEHTPLIPLAKYDLMLMGGGIATCSSMSRRSCHEQANFNQLAKSSNAYLLHPTTLQLFETAELFVAERKPLQQHLLQLFTRLSQTHNTLLSETELIALWRQVPASSELAMNGEELWQALSERELNSVLDYLEVPTLSQDGKYRLTEQVDLAQTTHLASAELYRQFVQLATEKAQAKGRTQAKVLVVTASSRDPFNAVDFYLDVFRQAGAKTQWLPLTAALQQALTEENCAALPQYLATLHGSYRREQIYADLFNQKLQLCRKGHSELVKLIEDADGIFFNGGDQSLTYQALRYADGTPTPELAAIFAGIQQQRLLVGGTSAGTAVMSGSQLYSVSSNSPVPMISNGDSYHALQYGAKAGAAPWPGCAKEQRCPEGISERQLTYTAAGGLGLFPLGILDTHFAERGRQARLLVLQQATQTRFGFGVDEATALLVDLSLQAQGIVQLAVAGAAEVYISELQQDSTPQQLIAYTFSLSNGDKAIWQNDKLSLLPATDKATLTNNNAPLQSKSPLFSRDHYRSLSHSLCQSNFAAATVSEPPYLIRVSNLAPCLQAPNGGFTTTQRLRITTEQ